MSFVYAFQLDNGIKIGKSDNPDMRKKQFQTSNTQDIIQLCFLSTPDSFHYENIIHQLLKKYKTDRKEIFNCSPEIVIKTFLTIEKYIKDISELELQLKDNCVPVTQNIDDLLEYNIGSYTNINTLLQFTKMKPGTLIEYITSKFKVEYLLHQQVFVNLNVIHKIPNPLYNWLNENIVYDNESVLTLDDIRSTYKNSVNKQSKLISDIDIYISENYTDKNIVFLDNYSYHGWSNLKLKSHNQVNTIQHTFITQFICKSKGSFIKWADLWEHYQEWYFDQFGNTRNLNKKDVKTHFTDKIFKMKENPYPSKGRGWQGWELKL